LFFCLTVNEKVSLCLLFLVSICSCSFLSFVCRDFCSLSFFTAWHNVLLFFKPFLGLD
jgi:hypothetical protein